MPETTRCRAGVFAILAACGGASCATTGGAPSGPLEPEIAFVQLLGAGEFEGDAVTKALANHSPLGLIFKDRARLERLALEADRRRVEVFFHEQGYFSAEVEDAEVVPQEEERVGIIFRVHLGAPSIVKTLEIRGAPAEPGLDSEALLALAAIPIGTQFRYAEYEAAKQRIHDRLFDSGYAHAKVGGEVEVARASSEVAIAILVASGPIVSFGPAVLTGSTALPASSLEARIAWREGDRFDPQRLTTTRRRIEELSLTGAVGFELEDGASTPVHVRVEDSLPNELRLGGGFGITERTYDVRARATYTRKNFFDPLYTLRTELRPALSYLNQGDARPALTIEANGEIIRDDFFLPRLTAAIGAGFATLHYEIYDTLGPSGYLTFGHPLLDDHLFLGLRLEVDYLGLSNKLSDEDRAKFGAYDPQRLAFIVPSISYDTRDDLLSPRKGYFFRLDFELGRSFGDGNISWIKVGPEARGYFPLFTERLIAAARIRAGATVAASGRVPLLRRYFSGGSESQRGFSRRFLSPASADSEGMVGPLGGEALLESSAELRLDLFTLFGSWVGIVGFVDAGDVTLDLKDLDPLNLHVAAGPGLRYRTPIGPIRLDFGIRVNRRVGQEPQQDSNWAFHFSLGEAF